MDMTSSPATPRTALLRARVTIAVLAAAVVMPLALAGPASAAQPTTTATTATVSAPAKGPNVTPLDGPACIVSSKGLYKPDVFTENTWRTFKNNCGYLVRVKAKYADINSSGVIVATYWSSCTSMSAGATYVTPTKTWSSFGGGQGWLDGSSNWVTC